MIDENFEPQWPVIVFGNGVQARAKRIIPNIEDENGMTIMEIHLLPTPEMQDYYNIKGNDLNKEGLLVQRYAQIDVIIPPAKKGTLIRSLIILPDFEGGQTPLTEKFPNTKLIKRYQVENKLLKKKIASLEDDIQLIMTRPEEYIKKRVAIMKMARSAGGDMVDPGFMQDGEMPGMTQQPGAEND